MRVIAFQRKIDLVQTLTFIGRKTNKTGARCPVLRLCWQLLASAVVALIIIIIIIVVFAAAAVMAVDDVGHVEQVLRARRQGVARRQHREPEEVEDA